MSLPLPSGAWGASCRLGVTLIALAALSLVRFVYERALVPLYGSGPTTHTLNAVVVSAALVAAVKPFRIFQTRTLLIAGVLFAGAPLSTYWVAVRTARWGRPVVGPLVTHLTVLAPLVSVVTALVVDFHFENSTTSRRTFGYRVFAGLACFGATTRLSGFWEGVSYLNGVSDSQIYLGLAAALFNLWIIALQTRRPAVPRKNLKRAAKDASSPVTKPSLVLVFNLLWWNLHPWLASPVLPHPLPQPYTHPKFPLQILYSVQSTTGLIVVGDALPPPTYQGGQDSEMHSLRYLRASHSLLGGTWMGGKIATIDEAPPLRDSFGTPMGDSIYGAFVLQEAARLVETNTTPERALIIGLGAGISATAFSRHNIATTIVEIDPAVYDAARLYFGLPAHPPSNLFLEDARAWAARRRAEKQNTLFDIVVHDCFSGGGVPEHIFTIQFWDDLKTQVAPQGIVVVNFAGMIKSESARMISQTLAKSFGTCRVFHDAQKPITEEEYETETINMAFFCALHNDPLTFRKALSADYLDSYLREFVLSSLAEREVDLRLLTGKLDDRFVLTDSHNPLGRIQDEFAHHHWWLMRQVLPNVFWETY
ncbi:spermidine synthase [Roridomyces roridus]|uniref:Spermidine synthase n=1 Tax=Roridomyces roridus TaxID=1738132 RepID=A0AAD7C594_9AGAR|nr:spermidine synthase [Roridomyces roridus]